MQKKFTVIFTLLGKTMKATVLVDNEERATTKEPSPELLEWLEKREENVVARLREFQARKSEADRSSQRPTKERFGYTEEDGWANGRQEGEWYAAVQNWLAAQNPNR